MHNYTNPSRMAVAISRKRKRGLGDLNSTVDDGKPRQFHFFVGNSDYKLLLSRNPVDYLIEYLNTCLTDTVGFVRDEGLELTNPVCYSTILTHMVCSILSYNKVPIKRIYQCMVNGSLIMAEPAILVNRPDQSIAFYISDSLVRSYTQDDNQITLNFDSKFEQSDISCSTVDDILKQVPLGVPQTQNRKMFASSARYDKMSAVDMLLNDNNVDDNVGYEYCEPTTDYKDRALKSKRSKVLYSLFVIADHAATHFLENGVNGSASCSFITHSNFGTKNIYTLHSAVKIIGTMNDDIDGWSSNSSAITEPQLFFNCLMEQSEATLNYEGGHLLL